MNDFTKEELETIESWGEAYTEFGNSWVDKVHRPLIEKVQSMIDNDPWDTKRIVKSHLIEAESLINHALELLRMTDE